MKPELQKQLDFVDWQNLGEEEIPEFIVAYASNQSREIVRAYRYFDNRMLSKLVIPEDFGPLSELLEKEGLVFAVPILLSLVSDPDIRARRQIIENLNQIARNIKYEVADSKEPYLSRANRIITSMKPYLPTFKEMLNSDDDSLVRRLRELINVLEKY